MSHRSCSSRKPRTALRSALAAAALVVSAGSAAADTIVEFDTLMGPFQVQLYDETMPITVGNFLSYVNSGRYDGTIVHRSVPGFVIQGGGYYEDRSSVEADAPIPNEGKLANVRGTLAVARLFSDLNSGTMQWYINTADNSALLGPEWAVFGHVIGDGMSIVDSIAALPVQDLSQQAEFPYATNMAFNEVPVIPMGTTGQALVSMNVRVVPEPQSWVLAGLGLATALVVRRQSQRRRPEHR